MWGDGATRSLLPRGEELRQAVRWISEQRKGNPRSRAVELVAQASLRFDLSPLEDQFLRDELVEEPRAAMS